MLFTSFVACVFGEVSIVYLVYKETDTGVLEAANAKGRQGSGQPIQNTRILAVPNTNYYLLFVTPKNKEGETFFNGLETARKILKISETKIETIHNDQTGGDETNVFHDEIAPLPEDWGRDWNIPEVKVSSP